MIDNQIIKCGDDVEEIREIAKTKRTCRWNRGLGMDAPEISPERQDAAQRAADELYKLASENRTRKQTFEGYTESRIGLELALGMTDKEHVNAQKLEVYKRIIKCGDDVEEIREIAKTKRIAMVHGVFDLLHYEHMRLFDFAKQHADYVIVSLVADRFVDKGPGRPVINEQNRAYMLASLRNVDKVILTTSILPLDMIKIYMPDVWIHGGRDHPTPENELLHRLNIDIIEYEHERTISTTDIINRRNS